MWGALDIPLRQLQHRPAELPRKRQVVAYCWGTYRVLSFEALLELRARGFKVGRPEAGFPEWKAAGLPVEPVVRYLFSLLGLERSAHERSH